MHPKCLVVFELAGLGLETLQCPHRRQQAEETVRWVDRVTCNLSGFAGETSAVNVQSGEDRDNDLLSCFYSEPTGFCGRR